MKIQKNVKRAAAIAVVCLAAYSASANVDYIGFKFVADDGLPGEALNPGGVLDWSTNVDGLAPWEPAGVPPLLVQTNWMNLGQYGTNVTLMDRNGTPTAVKASWYAAGMWYSRWNPSYPTVLTNDTKLMDGFLECTWSYEGPNVPIPPGTSILAMPNTDQPIIFLTGLDTFLLEQGGGTYSIIIYANTDEEGQGRVGQYFVDAASGTYDSIVDNGPVTSIDFTTDPPTSAPTPVYFDAQTTLFNGSNYTLIPVSATNNANAAWGNYIEFDGLTNDTILIRTQNSGSPGAPINAIQIVTWGVPCLPRIYLPVISPTNVISLGTTVTISAAAHVCGTAFYQWQTDGGGGGSLTNIPDATNSSVVSTPTTVGAWKYDVVLTNSYGSLTSGVATVTVLPASAPIMTQDTGTAEFGPVTNFFAFIGGNLNFYANFGLGTMPITNQWMFSTNPSVTPYAPVAGVGNNPWTVTNVQPSSAGFYELSATNAIGHSNSTPALLTALADPGAPTSVGTNMYSYCVYTNHPWAYWKFEETNDTLTSSMQAYDYSGHNFDATYGNYDGTVGSGCLDGGENISINGQYGPNPNDYLNGYPGLPSTNRCAELSYGYNNGYLKAPPLNLNTNTVTFTMWIYPIDPTPVIAANSGLLMNRNGSDAAGVGFSGNQNANLTASLGYTWNNNSSATYNWDSHLYPLSQQWQFVAYVISPQNTTIYLYYVSGVQTNLYKAVSTITNAPEAFSGGTTWLGSDNWDNNRTFNGYIDEVAVFNRAMSEIQVQDLFLKALGLPVPPPPPPWLVEPTNTTLFMGQMLQLTAIAGGIPTPHYQWQVWYNGTWQNLAGNPNLGIAPTTNTTLYWTNFIGAFSNFRCVATNYSGSSTSDVAVVTTLPVANWNKGLWTVNFAITPPDPYGPYVGRGVLGTNFYWNALRGSQVFGGMQFANTPPSLRDDGVTFSGINFGSVPIYMGAVESFGSNNALLDTYCHFVGAGAAFAFTSVPNGKYNLALYGIDGAYADLGTTFTVNGVSHSVTNAQDRVFLPDNTVVYTNVVVTNGTLNVTMVPIPRQICPSWGCPGAFNGAQLELIQYAPPPPIWITNINGQLVLQWSAGWKLLQATNVLGPWNTNNWFSPKVLTPTGQMQFFWVCTNSSWE